MWRFLVHFWLQKMADEELGKVRRRARGRPKQEGQQKERVSADFVSFTTSFWIER